MLFGNNMSWLYGKLKKKLDAPATAGSAGDVLTLGESGKPEWAEGGGGALPEVTSTDEGKVLTVVDNEGTYEWGAATPAGGGAIVVKCTGAAEYTFDEQNFWLIPLDTDISDIKDNLASGPVFFNVPHLQTTAPYYVYSNDAVQLLQFISASDESAYALMPAQFAFGGITNASVEFFADEDTGEPFLGVVTSMA